MMQLLVTDLATATKMLDAKYAQFARYEVWKQEVEEEAERCGYVKTVLGGIRHLRKQMLSENAWERAAAARQASNFQVQSGGAELAKAAMARLWDDGLFFRLDARFIAVIHDEVVWSVHRDHAWESIQIVWNAISQPYTPDFAVPFYGSVSLGKNLGDQIEYSDDPVLPTQEWVEKTIASLFAEA
jgi:DNA polymerase I-like protein with 3'-5' exonuclease and polymerase domains